MLNIITGKRVGKTEENIYGWESDVQLEDIDTTRPVVICFGGNGTGDERTANGMCKLVEGLYGPAFKETRPFDSYGIHFSFLPSHIAFCNSYYSAKINGEEFVIQEDGFHFLVGKKECVSSGKSLENAKETVAGIDNYAKQFVEKVFKPMVEDEQGNLRDPMEIARRFRNVIFVSFCFGSYVQTAINLELRNYLTSLGLDKESIEKLESQISVFQTSPIVEETNTNQTTVNFVSIDDNTGYFVENGVYPKAYYDHENTGLVGALYDSPRGNKTVVVQEFTLNENDDEHLGDFYLSTQEKWGEDENQMVGGMLPLSLALCLRRSVENAIFNNESEKYVPITSDYLVGRINEFFNLAQKDPKGTPEHILKIEDKFMMYEKVHLKKALKDLKNVVIEDIKKNK